MAIDKLEELHLLKNVKLPSEHNALKALANEHRPDVTLYEGGYVIPAAFLILALALGATAYQEFMGSKLISAIVLAIFALCLIVIFVRTMMRRKIPYMTLTEDGIVTSVFKSTLPWIAIEDFQINSAKTNAMNVAVGMEFVIADKYLPEQNDQCRGGSYYDAKTKKLMISGFNFTLATNRDSLIAMIEDYRKSALAREKLTKKNAGKRT